MKQVIITSKTQMKDAVCVGGLTTTGEFIRLLDKYGHNQPIDTEFEIRQVWNIEYTERDEVLAPHIEDVLIISKKNKKTLKNDISMLQVLKRFNVKIWRGNPKNLFDGCLQWNIWQGDTHKILKGYINQKCIPQNSVGFWLPDKDLYLKDGRYKYYNGNQIFSIKYVGVAEAIEKISRNTLCRVSLARWWDRNGQTEDRCHLQLSGFYI